LLRPTPMSTLFPYPTLSRSLTGRGPYVVEQVTFAVQLLRHVVRERPDVIYFTDPAIGKVLSLWRRRCGGGFRLLFSNSGPIDPRSEEHTSELQSLTNLVCRL